MANPNKPSANSLGPAAGAAAPGTIPIFETNPSGITLHRIEDHELEALTNISRPIALGIAGAATGGFLGLIAAAWTAFEHVPTKEVSGGDMVAVVVCAGCLVASVIAWPVAIDGQNKANAALKRIRARAPTQI